VARYADVLQLGARNMQNFPLLHAAGESQHPVLLKRGQSATIEEFLMAAEYILSHGNRRVILCERGIRTFETATRNTTDINAIPVLKNLTHLPVILDPSHSTGNWQYVSAIARAAIAAGADGLIIEVHPNPEKALSDGGQSLKPERFADLVRQIRVIAEAVGRKVPEPKGLPVRGQTTFVQQPVEG
jgi:3-deoxy-7-phosphoheptulonate synthase